MNKYWAKNLSEINLNKLMYMLPAFLGALERQVIVTQMGVAKWRTTKP